MLVQLSLFSLYLAVRISTPLSTSYDLAESFLTATGMMKSPFNHQLTGDRTKVKKGNLQPVS
jgi:hypothetical protein